MDVYKCRPCWFTARQHAISSPWQQWKTNSYLFFMACWRHNVSRVLSPNPDIWYSSIHSNFMYTVYIYITHDMCLLHVNGDQCGLHPKYIHTSIPGIIWTYIYLEPKWPLFLKVSPPKQGPNSNQNKGPHLGSRYIYIFILIHFGPCCPKSSNKPTSRGDAGANASVVLHRHWGRWIRKGWQELIYHGIYGMFTTYV